MKRMKRILLGLACVALLAASWAAAVTSKSNADRQRELIDQASAYTQDEIYILAVPLLEEAASYQDDFTPEAESALKQVYLRLAEKDNFQRRYMNLLEKQMARKDAGPEVFQEAALYDFEIGKTSDALAVLRNGIAKTGSEDLTRLYEERRYAFRCGRNVYDEASEIYRGTSQVAQGGLWGLASGTGIPYVPCEYDKISTFDEDRAIVQKDGVISAVDRDNNRVALLHTEAGDFGNYAENRLGLKSEAGWLLATGTFQTGSTVFEELGMFTGGYAPAKLNGKWGLVGADGGEWLIEPQYDDVVRDDPGRCGDPAALFVRRNGSVYLLKDGEEIAGPFEDARPFQGGWAAVREGGKWGFVDTDGAVRIPCRFDGARSFGQHLAAVKEGDLWGYVSLQGELVIEPQFLEAKSFSGGSAPVRTGLGWQFISLLEYEGGGGLF